MVWSKLLCLVTVVMVSCCTENHETDDGRVSRLRCVRGLLRTCHLLSFFVVFLLNYSVIHVNLIRIRKHSMCVDVSAPCWSLTCCKSYLNNRLPALFYETNFVFYGFMAGRVGLWLKHRATPLSPACARVLVLYVSPSSSPPSPAENKLETVSIEITGHHETTQIVAMVT